MVYLGYSIFGCWNFVFNKRKEGNWWLVPLWLIIGIIPAATARETPHALRIETSLPTFQILAAYGFVQLTEKIPKYKKQINYFCILVAFCKFCLFYTRLFCSLPHRLFRRVAVWI